MAGRDASADPSDDAAQPVASATDGSARAGTGQRPPTDVGDGAAAGPDPAGLTWRAVYNDLHSLDTVVNQAVTAETGLLGAQADMLLRLWRHPDRRSPMNALAADMRVSGSSLTKLVDRLTDLDLARRDASDSDRRVVYVVLTEHGEKQAEQVAQHYVDAVRAHVLAVIGADVVGLADLARLLT